VTVTPRTSAIRSASRRTVNAAVTLSALAVLWLSQASLDAQLTKQTPQPVVRVVYLVPADRVVRDDYVEVMEAAIEHVQIWFRNALGDGTTFSLDNRPVQVVRLPHDAAWYSTTPNGDYRFSFWFTALQDAFALTGGDFFDPVNIWIFYIDADPACGQVIGAAAGVALLSANDLRGLAGEENVPACSEDVPDTAGVCRWVGGLGHELGHALGLPHPAGCDTPDPNMACPNDALMWTGYTIYPNTFLLESEEAILRNSSFISDVHGRKSLPVCSALMRRPQ
jgi:hypothetical protein